MACFDAGHRGRWRLPSLLLPVRKPAPVEPAFFGVNGNNTHRASPGTVPTSVRRSPISDPGHPLSRRSDRELLGLASRLVRAQRTMGRADRLRRPGTEPFDNSLGPFRIALQRTGAQVLFMLNMLTVDGRVGDERRQPHVRSMTKSRSCAPAQAAGIGVERIELGNEFYLSAWREARRRTRPAFHRGELCAGGQRLGGGAAIRVPRGPDRRGRHERHQRQLRSTRRMERRAARSVSPASTS